MIRLNLTAILYSQKNIDLAYKVKKVCRDVKINVINAIDFVDLTVKIIEVKPQIVFFDLSTVQLEKQIMELFLTKGPYFIPNIILIYSDESQLQEYKDYNFMSVKLEGLEELLNSNEKVLKFNTAVADYKKESNINITDEINKHLFEMGFSPKHTGYAYLVEAIKILVKKNGIIGSLNNDIYPIIAAKFGTRITNVERNIRNAIVCAYNGFNDKKNIVDAEHLFKMFENRPTNREFICLCVEKNMSSCNCNKYSD
ncbi:MAG: sporulation initiation factor Spo0A C-terminal domain-containing protein [Spirochaetales bacterium]